MQAVTAALPTRTGGIHDSLTDMRRSRPALVRCVNDIFGDAFLPVVPRDQVIVKEWRLEPAGLSPALGLWQLHGKNTALAANALASGVMAMLADRAAWPVPDWVGRAPGPLRGSDIAVLCRSNDSARAVAEALAAAGLRVALGRGGLLGRAECVMALAGLRWLADATDSAALAELAHLAEGDAPAPTWLAAALTSADPQGALAAHVPGIAALRALRDRLNALTPTEALDAAVAALCVPVRLRAWGNATSRLANLEALRGLAMAYEEECAQGGLPTTAAGLCAWLAAEEAEEPASPDPDAVRVLTVHKAKGREWPVVIVADLDSEPKGRLFDKPVAMPCASALDPLNPLAGRWIRLWPWPYAKQSSGTGLDARAEATPTGIADAAQAKREAVRLLYVALTRARDWLILAPRVKAATKKDPVRLQTRWLDILGDLAPRLPITEQGPIRVGDAEHPCSVRDLTASEEDAPPSEATLFAPALPIAPIVALPRLIRPSGLAVGEMPVLTPVSLGPRLPLTGSPDMSAVGEAVHGFFAADRPDSQLAEREALAARLLRAWGATALSPPDVVQAANRLWAWLRRRWPDCSWHTEVPVFQRIGMQRLSGRVDLLVEHGDGLVVVDHKTFPGRLDDWRTRAAAHVPQLQAYAGTLESATGRHVTGLVLHLPVAGEAHEVRPS